MQILRRRTTAVPVIAVAALLVLAGCGSGSDSDSSPAPVAGATSTSTGSAAAPAAPGGTTAQSVFARMSTAVGQGQSVRGTTTTTTPDGTSGGEFAFEFTDAGLLAEFNFDQGGEKVNGVLTPNAMYVSGGGVPLPGGKTHIKIPLGGSDGLGAGFGVLAEGLTKAGDFDSLAKEWGGFTDIREVGSETVDGVQTTKYVGTVDPANPPANATKEIKKMYAELAKEGSGSITTTIWLDGQGRPVKFESKTSGANASTTVVTYTGWGEDVTVTVPPASKVAELPKL